MCDSNDCPRTDTGCELCDEHVAEGVRDVYGRGGVDVEIVIGHAQTAFNYRFNVAFLDDPVADVDCPMRQTAAMRAGRAIGRKWHGVEPQP